MEPDAYEVDCTFVDEEGNASTFALKTGTYILGRSSECDICFPTEAVTVSRKHACLTVTPDEVSIEDMDSRTGTMVNGRFMTKQRVENGDAVMIGGFTIKLSVPKADGAKKSAVHVPSAESLTRDADHLEAALEQVHESTDRLMAELGKRIVGQHDVLRSIWATILTREHCLMVGVPGLAKTLMVSTFSEALGLGSSRIQFTPDLMPSDIIGSNVIQETEDGRRRFEFVQGPIFTQLLLADEINRTPPKTQSALLEAMQERQVTVGNRSLSLPSPFCVIATQNPIEQEGTYPLPEAQQDRFMLCVSLDYPSRDDEVDILIRTAEEAVPRVEQVIAYEEILVFQRVVERITITRDLASYAADLARATRPGRPEAPAWVSEMVDWGAGPRAGQSLLRVSKALAAMEGRPAICQDDIRDVAATVLRHRISCNYRARTQGMDEDRIIERLLEEVAPGS